MRQNDYKPAFATVHAGYLQPGMTKREVVLKIYSIYLHVQIDFRDGNAGMQLEYPPLARTFLGVTPLMRYLSRFLGVNNAITQL